MGGERRRGFWRQAGGEGSQECWRGLGFGEYVKEVRHFWAVEEGIGVAERLVEDEE